MPRGSSTKSFLSYHAVPHLDYLPPPPALFLMMNSGYPLKPKSHNLEVSHTHPSHPLLAWPPAEGPTVEFSCICVFLSSELLEDAD